jgi:Uma2 family endonuclease
MTAILPRTDGQLLKLQMRPAIEMSDQQFFDFCRQNPDLQIERTAEGVIEIMAPAGGGSSNRNAIVTYQLTGWSLRDGTGAVFDSSGGFILPNGATRAPDAAWVRKSRLQTLTAEQKERFLPLCPDFVIEIRSPTDSLAATRAKMEEYIANGALLGWLIDVPGRQAWIFRPDAAAGHLDRPASLSGEPILPGFVLDLAPIWEPGF